MRVCRKKPLATCETHASMCNRELGLTLKILPYLGTKGRYIKLPKAKRGESVGFERTFGT